MATYNNYDFLRHVSLPSLLNQTFQDWKVIVTSDGLDNVVAREICESFGDDRIVYTEVERVLPDPPFPVGSQLWNVAGYNAVNNGLKIIAENYPKCKYIAHLDDDDYFLPNHLEVCYKLLKQMNGVDLVYSGAKYFSQNRYIKTYGLDEFNRVKLEKANYIAHSSIVYRKNAKHEYYYSGQTDQPSDYRHLKSFSGNMKTTGQSTVVYFQRCTVEFAKGIIKTCNTNY